jgi:multicomponent K+:H+ antiporter subunit A
VPLLNGFLSKEMFFAETVYVSATPWVEWGLPAAATLAGLFSVGYALRFSYDVFFGPLSRDLPREPHEPPRWMRVPIELLVLVCLVVGIAPAWSVQRFLDAAALPVVGGVLPAYSLAVWHGLNAPMIMSLIALAGGIVLYVGLRPQFDAGRLQRPPLIHYLDGHRLFHAALALGSQAARLGVRWLGTRRLQPQVLWVVLAVLLGTTLSLAGLGLDWGDRPRIPIFMLLWAIGIVCALGAAWQAKYHRLAALMMMSVAGLVTCITFMWFSAPDLALTQLSVEVVTTVLILLGLRWLPKRIEPKDLGWRVTWRDRGRRLRDLAIAISAGGGLAAVSYAMLTREPTQSISPYYLERALPEGGGTNVVNVILVDFRGFDTFGEITVLSVVALTVYALLRRFRPPVETLQQPAQRARRRTPRWDTCSFQPPWCGCCCRWPPSSRPISSCAGTTSRAAASSPAW